MRTKGRWAGSFILCALALALFAAPLCAEHRAVCLPEGVSAPSPLSLSASPSLSALSASSTLPIFPASSQGPLRKSQFLPPRHELAASAISQRRGRSGGTPGLPRTEQSFCSDRDRRTLKEAERASRSALLCAMRAYDHRFVNDITEGGKDVVREAANIRDWADAIPSVATD